MLLLQLLAMKLRLLQNTRVVIVTMGHNNRFHVHVRDKLFWIFINV